MKGYILRIRKEQGYLGIDKFDQDWMDYLSEWNILNPTFKIEIDEYISCHFSGEFLYVLRFQEWLNKLTNNDYLILYYNTDNLEIVDNLLGQNFTFIGYDVACLKEPVHLEEYFYSALFNDGSTVDDLLEKENNNFKFCNELNNYALFSDLSISNSFLEVRNKYYNKDSNNLFETFYGTNYEIVKIYLFG